MQNSVNHRVFERTLRLRGPPWRHVRLSVASVCRSSLGCFPLGATRGDQLASVASRSDRSDRRSWLHCHRAVARQNGSTRWARVPAAIAPLVGCCDSNVRPQLERDDPLNLSISISGGKETNQDSLSNGERSGNSSGCQSPAERSANCGLETPAVLARFPSPKLTWNGASERVTIP